MLVAVQGTLNWFTVFNVYIAKLLYFQLLQAFKLNFGKQSYNKWDNFYLVNYLMSLYNYLLSNILSHLLPSNEILILFGEAMLLVKNAHLPIYSCNSGLLCNGLGC